MNLSISNIGWAPSIDNEVFARMKRLGFSGLEIAPTKVFPRNPYDHLDEAATWASRIKEEWHFSISSMQSIWYGRSERIFNSALEKEAMLEYTKRAILFAEAVGCGNMVFGCPKNRIIDEDFNIEIAIAFFRQIGDFAHSHHTVIAMEANPPIYNTNFINTTQEAIELVRQVDSKGFLLNLDMGTMVENREDLSVIRDHVGLINNVHISEPGLKKIVPRAIHRELSALLRDSGYIGYVSIEVGEQETVRELEAMMRYVKTVFD